MSKRIAPSVELEAQLEELLSEGVADGERLSEVGRLGARLVLQQRRGWRASYSPGPRFSWTPDWGSLPLQRRCS